MATMPAFPRGRVYPLALAMASATFCVPASAQTAANESATPDIELGSPEASRWGLGVAASASQSPYRGDGSNFGGLPLLYYENAWFRFLGTSAALKAPTWRLGANNAVSFEGVVKYDGAGYDEDDSSALDGMDERKGGFWAGGAIAWSNPIARLSASWMTDISSESEGRLFELKLDRRFDFGRLSLTPRLQAQWLDGKYVDYYFGVRAHEALANRPRYEGGSGVAQGAGLRMDYRFDRHHAVFLDLGVTRLPDEIKDSPIVDRSTVSRATVGYLYRF